MLNIKFNQLQSSDLEQIYFIEQEAYHHLAWSKEALYSEISLLTPLHWHIEEDGNVLAYLFCRSLIDELHIINIAVSKTLTRKSLGTRLMNNLISYGKREKIEKLLLEVRTSNNSAYLFYKSLNFKEDYRSENLYQMGDQKDRSGIRMSLVLKE